MVVSTDAVMVQPFQYFATAQPQSDSENVSSQAARSITIKTP